MTKKLNWVGFGIFALMLSVGFVALLSLRSGPQQNRPALSPSGSTDLTPTASPGNTASEPYRSRSAQSTDSTDGAFDTFRAWLAKLESERKKGGAVPEQLLDEGRRLADLRRPAMLHLVRTNPWKALDQSIQWHEWAMLPPEVQSLVEEPFSEVADFESLSDCRPSSARDTARQSHFLRTTDRRFNAFVYGRRMGLTSKLSAPTQGIRIGHDVALWERPVLPLSSQELAAVRSRFPVGGIPGRSWRTGDALQGNVSAALIGGKLYYFNSPEEIAEVSQALNQGEQALGPNGASAGWAALEDGRTFDNQGVLAGSVSEQAQATSEISLRVNDASANARQISATIVSVSNAASQTESVSGTLKDASGSLASQSDLLREAVAGLTRQASPLSAAA